MKRLVALFVLLSALDIALTLKFVGEGTSTELNPIMVAVLAQPLPAVLLYKVGLPLVLGMALYAMSKSDMLNKAVNPKGALKLVVMLLVAVCLFNMTGLML